MNSDFAGLSLYLHIPFCSYRCSYCDFNTYTGLGDLKVDYAEALAREVLQVAGGVRRPVRTLFFGGGTPSLMPTRALRQILEAVFTGFDVAADAEFTLEANPETVDVAYLSELRRMGLNRLSFGAQSALANELEILGRGHDFQAVVAAVEAARAAGFDDYSLDLIYGVPGQTLASWEYSLEAVLALNPPHLSLYCLTIEPGTPMHRWLQGGEIQPPDPDLAADQYELAMKLLAAHGFVHYEISNWARPGHQSEHNLAYWRNLDYLGFGAGAHGHAAGYRYHVVRQPRVYIRRLDRAAEWERRYPWSSAVAEKYRLTPEEQMSDTVIMGLRLLQEGLKLEAFAARFGQTLDEVYGETVAELLAWGLLERENGRLRLTRQGRFVSNQVFHRFV